MLSAVAREALPANTKTNNKAVELMGSSKVVTEKKALKRLGSEMSNSMRVLQIKTERKEQKEESRRNHVAAGADLSGEGAGGGGGAGGERGGVDGMGASADRVSSPRASVASMRPNSPSSFAPSAMARRATRLLTEVPKFISELGSGSVSKADLSK